MRWKDKEGGDHAISSDDFFKGAKDSAAAEGKRTLNLQAKATCFTLKVSLQKEPPLTVMKRLLSATCGHHLSVPPTR